MWGVTYVSPNNPLIGNITANTSYTPFSACNGDDQKGKGPITIGTYGADNPSANLLYDGSGAIQLNGATHGGTSCPSGYGYFGGNIWFVPGCFDPNPPNGWNFNQKYAGTDWPHQLVSVAKLTSLNIGIQESASNFDHFKLNIDTTKESNGHTKSTYTYIGVDGQKYAPEATNKGVNPNTEALWLDVDGASGSTITSLFSNKKK